MIVERIEDDHDGVVTRELGFPLEGHLHELVALKYAGDHLFGGAVTGHDTHIECGVVEEDPDLGDLRRGLPFERLLLPESGCHRCIAPSGLVQ